MGRMDDQELGRWLMVHGGPVVRYRTARELLPETSSEALQALRKEVLAHSEVKYCRWKGWLEVESTFRMVRLHKLLLEASPKTK